MNVLAEVCRAVKVQFFVFHPVEAHFKILDVILSMFGVFCCLFGILLKFGVSLKEGRYEMYKCGLRSKVTQYLNA